MIQIFKRKAYKRNAAWPGGFEPNPHSRKTNVQVVDTEAEAIAICVPHNETRPRTGAGYYNFSWLEWTRI